jgi:hypothetical protein
MSKVLNRLWIIVLTFSALWNMNVNMGSPRPL